MPSTSLRYVHVHCIHPVCWRHRVCSCVVVDVDASAAYMNDMKAKIEWKNVCALHSDRGQNNEPNHKQKNVLALLTCEYIRWTPNSAPYDDVLRCFVCKYYNLAHFRYKQMRYEWKNIIYMNYDNKKKYMRTISPTANNRLNYFLFRSVCLYILHILSWKSIMISNKKKTYW